MRTRRQFCRTRYREERPSEAAAFYFRKFTSIQSDVSVQEAVALVGGPIKSKEEPIAMVTSLDSFKSAVEQYRQAQKGFVRGNPLPLKALCSHAEDVTSAFRR